jgi:hypothetical protein
MEASDRGVGVVTTLPEQVKIGLDLLNFPKTLVMQSGYNVNTLHQAARRRWRIDQNHGVM